jgi:hypothetical protein
VRATDAAGNVDPTPATRAWTVSLTGTIIVRKDAQPDDAQDFAFTAGGGLSPASFSLDDDSNATLSNTRTFASVPTGSGYSIAETVPSGWKQSQVTCDDGSPITNIDVAAGETVTCTFVNQKVYFEAPKKASPLTVALVPDFRQTISSTQCTQRGGAASAHGLPDIPGGSNPDTSCNPPALAAGTAAHFGARAAVSAQLTVMPGDLTTALDEADVSIVVNATDLRATSKTGADYNPNAGGPDLTLVEKLRITDTYNGGSLNAAATVVDSEFLVPVDCATTPDPTIGAACSTVTSANGVSPGMIREGKQAVLQVFRIRLRDSGANGIRNDGDDKGFAMQGYYVP